MPSSIDIVGIPFSFMVTGILRNCSSQEIIENRIAEEILQGNLKKGQKIIFDIKDKEIFITKI